MRAQQAGRRAAAVAETRDEILDAAERLFALEGIEGVSLRRVGVAAGAANHVAVQYHFGGKRELVRAIFERRLPSLEVRRAGALAEVKRQGRQSDPHALMEVILRPLNDEVDDAGRRSYAAFLLGLHHHGAFDWRADAADLSPLTSHVAEMLYASNIGVDAQLSGFRLESVFAMFLDTLVRLDRRSAVKKLPAGVEAALLADAIIMATAAFTAPPGQHEVSITMHDKSRPGRPAGREKNMSPISDQDRT